MSTLVGFRKSSTKNAKYDAIISDSGKIRYVPFGDNRYQHYHDRIGLYSNLNHNDLKRRDEYRKRHSAIKTKDGKLAYQQLYSPAYFSFYYLW